MKTAEANTLIGGLSSPSKMPCHGYSIPAKFCHVGKRMRNVANSICSKCYALKGRYMFPKIQAALQRRFDSLFHPLWVEAMVTAIKGKEKSGFFRWHDSGDIQNATHLENMMEVARRLPEIRFWLPTREYSIFSQWKDAGGIVPENVTVRFSALMFDGPAPESLAKRLGIQVSGASKDSFTCPASSQGNICADCRACWDKNVFNVSYKKH